MIINLDTWNPHNIFKLIKEKGRVNLKEMLTTFNYSIGMVIVSADELADCTKIGEIVEGDKGVKFKHKGLILADEQLDEL